MKKTTKEAIKIVWLDDAIKFIEAAKKHKFKLFILAMEMSAFWFIGYLLLNKIIAGFFFALGCELFWTVFLIMLRKFK